MTRVGKPEGSFESDCFSYHVSLFYFQPVWPKNLHMRNGSESILASAEVEIDSRDRLFCDAGCCIENVIAATVEMMFVQLQKRVMMWWAAWDAGTSDVNKYLVCVWIVSSFISLYVLAMVGALTVSSYSSSIQKTFSPGINPSVDATEPYKPAFCRKSYSNWQIYECHISSTCKLEKKKKTLCEACVNRELFHDFQLFMVPTRPVGKAPPSCTKAALFPRTFSL